MARRRKAETASDDAAQIAAIKAACTEIHEMMGAEDYVPEMENLDTAQDVLAAYVEEFQKGDQISHETAEVIKAAGLKIPRGVEILEASEEEAEDEPAEEQEAEEAAEDEKPTRGRGKASTKASTKENKKASKVEIDDAVSVDNASGLLMVDVETARAAAHGAVDLFFDALGAADPGGDSGKPRAAGSKKPLKGNSCGSDVCPVNCDPTTAHGFIVSTVWDADPEEGISKKELCELLIENFPNLKTDYKDFYQEASNYLPGRIDRNYFQLEQIAHGRYRRVR